MKIFVDTSAFYALADCSDAHHQEARKVYLARLKEAVWYTSDLVLAECWLLLHHRLGSEAARTFWQSIRRGVVRLTCVEPLDLDRAWQISERFLDQGFSLVDCTSFALMERLSIEQAFTYDHHFAVYRYGPGLRQAFTLLQ